MEDVPWLDESEERAWRALQVMQTRLTAALSRDLAEHSGLSYQDYLVLVVLTARDGGRARLFELGRALAWEKSRLSHQVSRMVDRGLLARETCPSDRRGSYVVVTDQGRREIEVAAPSHLRAVRRLFVDRLKPDQLEAMRVGAETVLDGITCPEDDTDGKR